MALKFEFELSFGLGILSVRRSATRRQQVVFYFVLHPQHEYKCVVTSHLGLLAEYVWPEADGPLSYVLYTAHSAWPSCLPCLAIALAVLVLAALASLLLVLIPGFLYVSFPFIK